MTAQQTADVRRAFGHLLLDRQWQGIVLLTNHVGGWNISPRCRRDIEKKRLLMGSPTIRSSNCAAFGISTNLPLTSAERELLAEWLNRLADSTP
jgi:hypothetical protein